MAKYRLGFVSNSSSSSFIVKGFVIPSIDLTHNKRLEIMDKFGFDYGTDLDEDTICNIFYYDFIKEHLKDKKNIYFATDTEDGAPNRNSMLIGELLAYVSDEDGYMPYLVIDTSITPVLEDLKQKFDIDGDVKVVCGTRYC